MALMTSQFGRARYANTIVNRTAQSGGSVGGNKKAGLFGGSVGWPVGNMGSHVFWRAPQRPPTLIQSMLLTTKHPVQRRRNGYSISHGQM